MKQQTIQEWFRRVDAPGMQEEDYCIYVIRDPAQVDLFSADGTVFYVGQSSNPHNRLMVHMGLLWPGPSHVGYFIRANVPYSGTWLFEQYILEECRSVVMQHRAIYPQTSQDFYAACGHHYGVNQAEEALIWLYRPCLNTAANPNPTPLPVVY